MVQRRYAASGPAAIRWERCNVDTLLGVRGLALGDGVLISQHMVLVRGVHDMRESGFYSPQIVGNGGA